METWPDAGELNDRARQYGSYVEDTMYMLPYGFYLRAMFYNKKLFAEAGARRPAERRWTISWRRPRRSRRLTASPAIACAAGRAAPTARS